jgi:hypothetical protein
MNLLSRHKYYTAFRRRTQGGKSYAFWKVFGYFAILLAARLVVEALAKQIRQNPRAPCRLTQRPSLGRLRRHKKNTKFSPIIACFFSFFVLQ